MIPKESLFSALNTQDPHAKPEHACPEAFEGYHKLYDLNPSCLGGRAMAASHKAGLPDLVWVTCFSPKPWAEPRLRESLEAAFDRAQQLKHAGLQADYRLDLDGEAPMLLSEALTGLRLDLLLDELKGQLPAPSAYALGALLAQLLSSIHEELELGYGLLNPKTIWISLDGEPRLLSYTQNQALNALGLEQLTTELPFVPPETADLPVLGPAADVYALGQLLIRLLRPEDRDPPRLANWLKASQAPQPGDRPQDFSDCRRALANLLPSGVAPQLVLKAGFSKIAAYSETATAFDLPKRGPPEQDAPYAPTLLDVDTSDMARLATEGSAESPSTPEASGELTEVAASSDAEHFEASPAESKTDVPPAETTDSAATLAITPAVDATEISLTADVSYPKTVDLSAQDTPEVAVPVVEALSDLPTQEVRHADLPESESVPASAPEPKPAARARLGSLPVPLPPIPSMIPSGEYTRPLYPVEPAPAPSPSLSTAERRKKRWFQWGAGGVISLSLLLTLIALLRSQQAASQTELRISTTPPGARVLVDGKILNDATPLQVPIAKGKPARIEIVKEGHFPYQQMVPASDQAVVILDVSLSPSTGRFQVIALPATSEIWVNGRREAQGRLDLADLPLGQALDLRITHPDFPDYTQRFVPSSETARIAVLRDLRQPKPTRNLRYRLKAPAGRWVEIFAEGTSIGTTPLTLYAQPGVLELQLSNPRDRLNQTLQVDLPAVPSTIRLSW